MECLLICDLISLFKIFQQRRRAFNESGIFRAKWVGRTREPSFRCSSVWWNFAATGTRWQMVIRDFCLLNTAQTYLRGGRNDDGGRLSGVLMGTGWLEKVVVNSCSFDSRRVWTNSKHAMWDLLAVNWRTGAVIAIELIRLKWGTSRSSSSSRKGSMGNGQS